MNPAAQPTFNITLAAPYPIPLSGSLTLEFTPDAVSPADDPAIQFSAGGRTLNFTIPAGQTSAFTTPPAIQTGTVAGAIKLTLRLTAAGQDITPTPVPAVTVQVARSAPVLGTVQVVRTSGGFEVRVAGYSTPRQMTQAVFNFTAAAQGAIADYVADGDFGHGLHRLVRRYAVGAVREPVPVHAALHGSGGNRRDRIG